MLPANTYVIDLDAVEGNARCIAERGARHGLKTFAMTKQMGRNGSFCRAVARGRHRHSGRGRHGMRAGLPSGRSRHRSYRPSRPDSPGRSRRGGGDDAGLLDCVQRREGRGGGRGERPSVAACSPYWLASLRRAIRSIAVMRAVFRRRKSSPSPTRSTAARRAFCRRHPISDAVVRSC